jgi:cytochrome c oxidase subunit 2
LPPSALDPHSPAASVIATNSWILFGLAAAGCLLVFGLLLYALWRRPPAEAAPNRERGDVVVDHRRVSSTAWIVGGGIIMPAVILVIVFGLGVGTLNAQPSHAAPGDAQISVIGHQWWWEVYYPAGDFYTANEIHIPVGQDVAIQLTTADVIHSFWVPELAGKLDLIPGQTNTLVLHADQAGDYRGQCAEFCGVQHALMAFLVVAQPADQYAAWLSDQAQAALPPVTAAAESGQQVFLGSACVYCHTVRGTNATGQVGPDLTHVGSRRTLAAATLFNGPGSLAGWVIDPQGVKPGNFMPPTDLSGQELQDLLAYLTSLQ